MSPQQSTDHEPVSREEFEQLQAQLADVDDYQTYLTRQIRDLEDEVEVKSDRIQSLEREVAGLQHELEELSGLSENESSTPAKRAADLRDAMKRIARNSGRAGVTLYYKEAGEHLSSLGHSDLHDPQLYDAMWKVVENCQGFEKVTTEREGREVDAIRLKLAALPENEAVNEINNGEGVARAADGGESESTADT